MTERENELFGFSEQQLATMIETDLSNKELYNLAQERRFYINDLKEQIEKMKNCGNCKHCDIRFDYENEPHILCVKWASTSCKSSYLAMGEKKDKDYWECRE